MEALPLTITDAGLAAMVDAGGGGIAAITLTEIGLTNTAFVAAPDIEALPDEIKRLDTISGTSVDSQTLHMTMRDNSDDEYAFNGFGIYMSTGELFATYSQADPIAAKAPVSLVYVAFDMKLSAEVADIFEFGDANFLNPPATTDTAGVAYLATQAEVEAGEEGSKIVTPELLAAVYVALAQLGVANGVATLGADGKLAAAQRPSIDAIDVFAVASEAAMLALDGTAGDFAVRTDTGTVYILQEVPASVLGNWVELNTPAPVTSVNGKTGTVALIPGDIGAVPTGRTVTGSGIATGGGDLSANRTIDVPKASQAEASAGVNDSKAVTPYALAGALAAIGAGVPTGRQITGSGLATGGGDLSADRAIHVAIASAAEAWAAAIDNKAVTPAALATLVSQIASKVPTSRSISTSGLASGGGNFNANRNINVPAASAAEVLAGSINNKAVTPASLSGLIDISGSGSTLIIKVGSAILQIFAGYAGANGSTTITLPESFPSTCVAAFCNGGLTDTGAQDNGPYVSSKSANSVTVFNATNGTAVQILAIGK